MKQQPSITISAESELAMQKDSRTISKLKPKIRVIHIVAPEIIKTDVAGFRELVQRLTGKPVDGSNGEIEKTSNNPTKEQNTSSPLISENREPQDGKRISHDRDRLKKGSKVTWVEDNSSSFMNVFGDVGGLFQDLREFPLPPPKSSLFSVRGGMPLCK
ncbi:hypothetical protein NMG60_11023299 [Bertholletia excelsa]